MATILQFGTGKFLRAFADLFVHERNQTAPQQTQVVAIQSTGSDRVTRLVAQQGRYHVALRGLEAGQPVDQVFQVQSIGRALAATEQWAEVLQVGQSERLAAIVSNTTEAGYALDLADRFSFSQPPRSFPAKLLAVLHARFEAGLPGVTILPCELLERNGPRLCELVCEQAERWALPSCLVDWLRSACMWRSTLVDRIVAAPKPDDPLATQDPLFAVAEPFALWLIEGAGVVPVFEGHEAVERVEDLTPYQVRKVRILNGAHTALVAKALPLGFQTVRQAVLDPQIGRWLEQLLFEEVVPTLEGRTDQPAPFARQCLERFANPFIEHRLADIALAHDTKLRTRLLPTYHEFRTRFGRTPRLLAEVLAGLV